jgi:hypothetical protein
MMALLNVGINRSKLPVLSAPAHPTTVAERQLGTWQYADADLFFLRLLLQPFFQLFFLNHRLVERDELITFRGTQGFGKQCASYIRDKVASHPGIMDGRQSCQRPYVLLITPVLARSLRLGLDGTWLGIWMQLILVNKVVNKKRIIRKRRADPTPKNNT